MFRSRKQQKFFLDVKTKNASTNVTDMERFFGTRGEEGNYFFTPSAMTQWASYGARSMVPVFYVFEVDNLGVVRHWKVGARGNLRDGAGPNPKKANLIWERPENIDASHLDPTEAEAEEEKAKKKEKFLKKLGKSTGEWIGTEGEKKHNFGPVTLVYFKEGYFSPNGYNTVERHFQMFKDSEGRIIYYTGKDLGVEKGQTVELIGTVKKHLVSKKQDKVTVVSYPKVKTNTEKS
jgi:hypothetical protein